LVAAVTAKKFACVCFSESVELEAMLLLERIAIHRDKKRPRLSPMLMEAGARERPN